jgi:hypothetical protein
MMPSTEQELDEFLRAFESGDYPSAQWTHGAHLAMAGGYLTRMSAAEAVPFLREKIAAYNVAQGGVNSEDSGYHESLTIFWVYLVAAHLASLDPSMSRVDKVRNVVETFTAHRDIFRGYWSFDVTKSVEARKKWVPPDLRPLPAQPRA